MTNQERIKQLEDAIFCLEMKDFLSHADYVQLHKWGEEIKALKAEEVSA